MKFSEFDLNENILQGIEEAGFTDCMPVQERTFEYALKGRDVAVQSQTGTGKTAAFLIPVFKLFKEGKNKKALIIVPTRELAVQIEEEAKLLGKYLDLRIGSFYGGIGYNKQESILEKGVDIMIGTPGRLIDFGKSGKIKFNEIGMLIIDEADRLFDMGFIPDLRWMIRKMVSREERITMLFSATLNSRVRQLAWEYMNDPAEIEITPENLTVDEIEQVLYHVSREEKMKLLLGILDKEKPASTIIFTNTKQKAEDLSKRLTLNGYKSHFLIGDMPQKKRLAIINRVKAGEINMLVATDVAARGLHINDLEMVFNYDLPEDCENYVHRIGRTARAGKTGKAVSLACEKYVFGLSAIENYINMKIPVAWAEDTLFKEDKSEGMHFSRERRGGGRNVKTSTYSARRATPPPARRKEADVSPAKPQKAGKAAADQVRKKPVPKPLQKREGLRKEPAKQNSFEADKKSYTGKPQGNMPVRKSGGREKSLEERIEYYREKYGENIKLSQETEISKKTEKKSIFKRVRSLFKK